MGVPDTAVDVRGEAGDDGARVSGSVLEAETSTLELLSIAGPSRGMEMEVEGVLGGVVDDGYSSSEIESLLSSSESESGLDEFLVPFPSDLSVEEGLRAEVEEKPAPAVEAVKASDGAGGEVKKSKSKLKPAVISGSGKTKGTQPGRFKAKSKGKVAVAGQMKANAKAKAKAKTKAKKQAAAEGAKMHA